MQSGQLLLKRLVIAHYKSIRRIELETPPHLIVLVGRNNAGKSNILDALVFVSDAARGFEHALSSRGDGWADVLHKKRDEDNAEVVLDFTLPEEERIEYIIRLFGSNPGVEVGSVIDSHFLRVLTLRLGFGKDHFREELTVSNLRPEARPCLLFQACGSPGKVELSSGQLEALCARCVGDLPHEPLPLAPPSTAAGPAFRFYLGKPEGSEAYPVSHELALSVHDPLAALQWINPLRHLTGHVAIQGETELAPNAGNLPDVLHSLYNNRPKLFRRIEAEVGKLVPELGGLYTPTFKNTTTVGVVDSKDEDLTFTMDQMSFGTKSALAIITKVVLAPPGTWICVEEPETHLHPLAQKRLVRFLLEEAREKRIFVATHSTPVAGCTPLASLLLVERDGRNCTTLTPVGEAQAHDAIDHLEVRPSFDFTADALVFVEELDDLPLYQAWVRKHPLGARVQFVDAEGADTLHYYANTRVALSKHVDTLVYVVFGALAGQDDRTRRGKQRLVEQLELPPNRIVTLDVGEVESYLFDSGAIVRAFYGIGVTEAELEQRLAGCRSQADPKRILHELLRDLKLGGYDAQAGARIASAMNEIPGPIAALFDQIETESKPFWGI